MTLVAGVDVGSSSTKALLLAEDGQVRGSAIVRTRLPFDAPAREAYEAALRDGGVRASEVRYVAASGLGRHRVEFRDIAITDITCGARGAAVLDPGASFVLDIGAQSTRAVRLKEGGRVREFQTNEKCAAGSGSFLERAAKYLEVPLTEVGGLSLRAASAKPISSICAVLAESEIINHVSEGVPVPDILRGIHDSLADRALAQLRRVGLNGPVLLIGGVARQDGMIEACRAKFGVPIRTHPLAPFAGALGAARLGWQRLAKAGAHAGSPKSQ